MMHVTINSHAIYYVIILLDKIQKDIILITLHLINEIIWEIQKVAQLDTADTYVSLAFARWRDLQ